MSQERGYTKEEVIEAIVRGELLRRDLAKEKTPLPRVLAIKDAAVELTGRSRAVAFLTLAFYLYRPTKKDHLRWAITDLELQRGDVLEPTALQPSQGPGILGLLIKSMLRLGKS